MAVEIEQGLYIASLGMGIVFLSLVILLVIVLLLRMLPHETDPHTTDNTEDRGNISAIQGDSKSSNKGELQPPIKSERYTNTQEVAAMAVSLYLTLEEELDTDNPSPDKAQDISSPSKWKTQGRSTLMAVQGHRPAPFGERQYRR